MLIVTTIYCAESEPNKQPGTEKVVEMSMVDLKSAARKLLNVYQGTSRVLPAE
ncbi:MAG: hypothetical protein WBX19_17045 [Terracidiphilus sp.]